MRTIILSMLLVLAGCTTVKTEYITVKEFVPVPVELTPRVPLSAPFDPVAYSLQENWEIKEGMLFELIQTRTTEVGVCNARLDGVNKWSLVNEKIYNGKLKE